MLVGDGKRFIQISTKPCGNSWAMSLMRFWWPVPGADTEAPSLQLAIFVHLCFVFP